MIRRNSLKLLAAIGVGGGLALVGPMRPAVGFHSPPAITSVEVGDDAALVARGAAIAVPIEVRCTAGSQGFLSVSVTQRAGSRIASGGGSTSDFTCTGSTQIVTVTVTANDLAFKRGTAVAQASLTVCSPEVFFCDTAVDDEIIQISR